MYAHIEALREAIRHFKQSQAALARSIGVGRSTVNNWLNGRARISYYYAVKIELVTKGQVKREALAPWVQFTRNKNTPLPDYVSDESSVVENASSRVQALKSALEKAEAALSVAALLATLPPDKQDAVMTQGKKTMIKAAKQIHHFRKFLSIKQELFL